LVAAADLFPRWVTKTGPAANDVEARGHPEAAVKPLGRSAASPGMKCAGASPPGIPMLPEVYVVHEREARTRL